MPTKVFWKNSKEGVLVPNKIIGKHRIDHHITPTSIFRMKISM